jgi:purine-binding chemotaxis protein CheW
MNEQSYLTFSSNDSLYGISTAAVEEIVPLPELTVIPEMPHGIVGAFDLRGKPCLTIDLALSFGHQSPDYQLSDSVVVITGGESRRVGVIANKVFEVKSLSLAAIPAETFYLSDPDANEQPKLGIQLAKAIDDVLILSDPTSLIQIVERQQFAHLKEFLNVKNEQHLVDAQLNSEVSQAEPLGFYPTASASERMVFRQRANDLRLSNENPVVEDFASLVIIALNEQLLGISSAIVQEFVDISKVTPIPCCPAAIVGNMNLRGEILTLIDIRGLLNLPTSAGPANDRMAMVVKIETITAGILVEEVRDSMFLLNPRSVKPASASVSSVDTTYLQGIVPYEDQILQILDFPTFFLKSGLLPDKTT